MSNVLAGAELEPFLGGAGGGRRLLKGEQIWISEWKAITDGSKILFYYVIDIKTAVLSAKVLFLMLTETGINNFFNRCQKWYYYWPKNGGGGTSFFYGWGTAASPVAPPLTINAYLFFC